jgi:hypothetical protein
VIRQARIGSVEVSIVDHYELDEFQDRTWALILSLWAYVFGATFRRSGFGQSVWLRVYLGWCCLEIYWDRGPEVVVVVPEGDS